MLCPYFLSALPPRNKNPLGTAAVEGDNSREQKGALSLLLLLLPGMHWAGRACCPPTQFIQHSIITHSPRHGQGGDRSLQGQGRALGSLREPLPGGQRLDLPEPPIPSPAPASPWAGLVPLVPVVFPFCFPGSLQWLSNDRNTDY